MKTNNFKSIIAVLAIFAVCGMAKAATITSAQNGNWNSTASWVGGQIPALNDDVVIAHNITINTDADVSVKNVTILNYLQFNNASTVRKLVVNGNLVVSTGGTFLHNNNKGWPVEIYGNFTIDGTYETTAQDANNVQIIMKGDGGTLIGGLNLSNNNGSRRFINLTIDLDNPEGVVSLLGNLYFAEPTGSGNNIKLVLNNGIFDARGHTIQFWKFGTIEVNNGSFAWKHVGCDFTDANLPNIYFYDPCCGSNLNVNGSNPTVYINNFGFRNNNANFPNNANANIYVFGTFTRSGNLNNGAGNFYWGENSNYIPTSTEGNQPGPCTAVANGPANINSVPNPTYTVPSGIINPVDACLSVLPRPVPSTTDITCNSITIKWDTVQGAQSYNIYRGTTGLSANKALQGRVLQTDNVEGIATYTFNSLSAGTTYYFWVEAVDEDGEKLSEVINGITDTRPSPSDFSAVADTLKITLSWNEVQDAMNYTLYKCTSSAMDNCTQLATGAMLLGHTDLGLDEGTTYYYKVVAEFAGGCSSEATLTKATLAPKYIPSGFDSSVTGITCGTTCSNRLLGYVDFNYANGVVPPASWTINEVGKYGYVGAANQTLGIQQDYQYSGTADIVSTNRYTIVSNPSTIRAGEGTNVVNLMNLTNNPFGDGGFLILAGNNDNAFTYRIGGLQGNGTDLSKYCIRVKIYNPGQKINNDQDCDDKGNNMKVVVTGASSVVGKYKVDNIGTVCPSANPAVDWNGENVQLPILRKYGDYAVFEGTVTLNGSDNFTIGIKPLDKYKNAILGIASIEVYGCIPKNFDVLDKDNNVIAHNQTAVDACEFSQVTLSAASGFGDNLVWYRNGEVITGETDNTLVVNTPAEDVTEVYRVVGSLNDFSVTLKGVFCCSGIGESVVVHSEYFNGLTYGTCNPDANRHYADLPGIGVTNFISVNYQYAGANNCNVGSQGSCWNCVDDGEYAVIQNVSEAHANWGWENLPEHTGVAGSGMLLVNAATASGDDYFYSHNLTEVCDNTRYEFSVWYAALKPNNPAKVNIALQVWPVNSDGDVIGTTPIAEFITGDVNDAVAIWHQAVLTFTTGSAGRYMFKVRNNTHTTENNGNDILLDDIVVTKCAPRFGTVEESSRVTSVDVCVFNPAPVTLVFDAPYSIKQRVGNGGDVWVQWAYADVSTGPWIPLGDAVLNDTIHAITQDDYPTSNGATRYYLAKLSVDESRAESLSPLLDICGNDAVSEVFALTRMIAVEADINADTIRVCAGRPVNIVGLTDEPTAQWGWIRGTVDENYIEGYELSAVETNRTYTKTSAAEEDEGMYYFYVTNGQCSGIDSVYLKVLRQPENMVVYHSMCENESYHFQIQEYGIDVMFDVNSESGTYTYSTTDDCVSQVTLHLTVIQPFFSDSYSTVCANEFPILWHGQELQDIGIYYDSLYTVIAHCDSIYKITLTSVPMPTRVINDTICGVGALYRHLEVDYTETGSYEVIVPAALPTDCDTVVTLNLWFGIPHTINLPPDRICSGQNYTEYGFNLINVTESGTYELNLRTTLGCDSTVKIELTVDGGVPLDLQMKLCADELPKYIAELDTNFAIGTQSGVYNITRNCIVHRVELEVGYLPEITLETPETVCADAGNFSVIIAKSGTYNHFYTDYQIAFNANALGAGFVNASGAVDNPDELNVAVPANVRPNHYSATITFTDSEFGCVQKPFEVPFDIYYASSVVEQKWNDVLAVLNDRYNGGYDFSAFQWYKNGQPISGETNSYVYLPEQLDFTACYSVSLTRKDDGVTTKSCEFCPVSRDGFSELPAVQRCRSNNCPRQFSIKSPQSGVLRIFSVTGILVGQQNIQENITEVYIQLIDGMYIFEMTLKDGTRASEKVVKTEN